MKPKKLFEKVKIFLKDFWKQNYNLELKKKSPKQLTILVEG